jgi:hypothetical protein
VASRPDDPQPHLAAPGSVGGPSGEGLPGEPGRGYNRCAAGGVCSVATRA